MSDGFIIKVNPFRWLIPVSLIWLSIIGAAYCLSGIEISEQPYVWTLLFVIFGFFTGILQHHLSMLGHDGAHYLAAKNKKLNDFLTTIFAFGPMLVNLTNYRQFHGAHHQYVGTDKDTEMPLKKVAEKKYTTPQAGRNFVIYFFQDLFLLGGIKEMNGFISMMLPGKLVEALATWVLSWGVIAGSLYALSGNLTFIIMIFALWFFGLIFSFWASFRLRVYFEHVGFDAVSEKGYQEQKTQAIEFTAKLAWFRFLSCWWGIYHIYHHMNQHVPIHQLEAYKQYLIERGQAPKTTLVTNPVRYLGNIGREEELK